MSLLHQHHSTDAHQQSLLNESEIHKLRLFAEQVDCSASLSQTLLSRDAGWLPTKPRGSGMDYAESRVYQQGDDPRYIDWRVSARSQQTFVKTYHMESRPGVCLVVDKRRSMMFGTRRRLKVAQALRIAVMLAYVAERHHMTLSALIIEDEFHFMKDMNVSSLLELANSISRPVEKLLRPQSTVQPRFNSALTEVKQQTPKGSLVYLMSDFMDVTEADKAGLVQLQESYFVQAVHVMDFAELELPPVGEIRLKGMRGGLSERMSESQTYLLNTQKAKESESFVQYAQQTAQNKKDIISESGCSYVRVMTDQEPLYSLVTMPLGKGG